MTLITKFTPAHGFRPLDVRINEDTRMSFFKACNTTGTATNYMHSEINRVYDRVRGSAVDELKFFAGILFPISVIALVFNSAFGKNQRETTAVIDYSIIALYFLIILALVVRAYMVLRISKPNFDSMNRFYVWPNQGNSIIDLELKEDYQWAEQIEKVLMSARKYEKTEKIGRMVILGIISVFTALMTMLFYYPNLFM